MRTETKFAGTGLAQLCKKEWINLLGLRQVKGLSSSSSSKGHSDAIIIGGGAMGSSIAYFLKSKAPDMNVTVIEKDSKVLNAIGTNKGGLSVLSC